MSHNGVIATQDTITWGYLYYLYSASRGRAVGSIRPPPRADGVSRLPGLRGAHSRDEHDTRDEPGPFWALDQTQAAGHSLAH
eukprot:2657049-Heterocapsa_arctica.AAC.2